MSWNPLGPGEGRRGRKTPLTAQTIGIQLPVRRCPLTGPSPSERRGGALARSHFLKTLEPPCTWFWGTASRVRWCVAVGQRLTEQVSSPSLNLVVLSSIAWAS